MRRPLAILLDLDGTLVDAGDAIAEAVIALASDAGLSVPTHAWVLGRIGYSPHETWEMLGADDPVSMTARFRAGYVDHVVGRTRVLDGVPAALASLAASGYRLAVASTRPAASSTETLLAKGILVHVHAVVGGDEVAAHKPAPDVLHLALERLGLPEGPALMVGDTAADVEAARAAGLPCWGVLGGTHDEGTLREAGADLILSEGVGALPEALARHFPGEASA